MALGGIYVELGEASDYDFEKDMAAPALVVAAGGARLDTEADALQMAFNVVQAKAAGITFGRNIWQSGDTVGMIRALRHIVHDNGSVEEAIRMLNSG